MNFSCNPPHRRVQPFVLESLLDSQFIVKHTDDKTGSRKCTKPIPSIKISSDI
jgi:hypothetical protein